MLKFLLLCIASCLLLGGCGNRLSGTYVAEARAFGTPARMDPGFSTDEINARLAANPSTMELGADGKFKVTSAGRVWEGTWTPKEDRIHIKMEKINGVPVDPKTAGERDYLVENGAIVDNGTYAVYGTHIIYKKKG